MTAVSALVVIVLTVLGARACSGEVGDRWAATTFADNERPYQGGQLGLYTGPAAPMPPRPPHWSAEIQESPARVA